MFGTGIDTSKLHILTPIGSMGFRQSTPCVPPERMLDVMAEDADGPAGRLCVTHRAD